MAVCASSVRTRRISGQGKVDWGVLLICSDGCWVVKTWPVRIAALSAAGPAGSLIRGHFAFGRMAYCLPLAFRQAGGGLILQPRIRRVL